MLIAVFALAGCADVGPFRASSPGDSSDGGVGGGDAAGDGAGDPDATPGMPVTPEQVAITVDDAVDLCASGGYLSWEEHGSSYSIARVASAGGQVKRLASTDVPFRTTTTTDGRTFWTTNASVVAANSAFTGATPLVTSSPLASSIAVSSQHVYFARKVSATWNLERVPRAGGTVEPLYTGLATAPVFEGGTSSLYWLVGGELRRSAFSSPTTYAVETAVDSVNVFVGGATACWVSQPDINLYNYDVWCQRQGQKTRISTGNSQIFDLDVGDDAVYLATRLDATTGRIRRYDFTTKQLSTSHTAPTGSIPTSLARDASYLYWIESQGVWRQMLE